MTQTEARIFAVMRDHFGRSSYPGKEGESVEEAFSLGRIDAKLIDDLKLDSLDMIELAMAIEEEFGIEVSDVEFAPFGEGPAEKSIGDLAALVDGKLASKVAA